MWVHFDSENIEEELVEKVPLCCVVRLFLWAEEKVSGKDI